MAEVETNPETFESQENISDHESEDESKENAVKSAPGTPKATRTPLKTLPLFDSPLEQSGKRVRNQAPVFKVEQKEEFKYEFNGSGVALGDIAYTEFKFSREMADDLKKLHSVCFNRPGDRQNVKKNLRQFNGFPFDKSDKKYEDKKNKMEKIFKADLSSMCKILGLEVSGQKSDVVVRILDFLLKPVDQKRAIPKKKSKKSKKKGDKKKRSDTGKKRGPRKSKGGDTENDTTVNDSTADESMANETADSSDSGSESDTENAENEKPKKTPAKKTPAKKTPAKKVAKKTPAKKTPAKKTPAKKTPAKRSNDVVDSDSDSSDDEPLVKKQKTAPTNDEIEKKIKDILDGANLEEVTMKVVLKQVYELYPDFDITDRKSFIKETVRSVLG